MKVSRLGIDILVLILLIGACAKAPSQFYVSLPERIPMEDQALFSRAIAHQKKGQIEPAIGLWERFLEKYPNSYRARNNLGFLYYANDQITDAIIQFEQGLNLEPGSMKIKDSLLRALKVRIVILGENKENDEAIIDLKRMAELSPTGKKEKIERQIESFEDKIFEQVKKSDLKEEYQEFLKKYPNSPKNSDEARLWIKESQQTQEIKHEGHLSISEPLVLKKVPDAIGSSSGVTNETIEESVISENESAPAKIPAEPIEEALVPPVLKMVEVIKPKVINVHSEPKIESGNIVHKLKTGAKVIYIDESQGWYLVEFGNGKKGWIIKKYTRLLE